MSKKKSTFTFSGLSPVLLVVTATLVGVALGKTWGSFAIKTIACCLMALAFALRYMKDRKFGLYLEIGLVAVYTLIGLIFRCTSPWSWLIFAVGTLIIDLLIGVVYRAFDALHRETEFGRAQLEQRNTIDESTQLRNVRAYLNDAMIFIRFTRRYQLHLGLILWRLDNTNLLRSVLGKVEFDQLIKQIAEKLRVSLRFEDMIFTFEDKQSRLTIGTLHVANNQDVCQIVEKRMRAMLDTLDLPQNIKLLFSTGSAMIEQIETDSPMALLERAKEKFE